MTFVRFYLLTCLALIPRVAVGGSKDEAKPVNLEKLNTTADDVDPCPVDNLNLLYATNAAGKFEVRHSKRSSAAAAWPAGKVYRPYLSAPDHDCRGPFYRGGTLFFSQNKIPDVKFEDLRNFDLVQAVGERAPLPLIQISEAADEMFPAITAGGKEFYFSRKTKEGWKQMTATGPLTGGIGKAREVGFPAGFHHATFMPTGLVMFLEGPLESGRTGIFRAKRPSLAGKWSDPEPVAGLNTSTGKIGTLGPSLSPDGTRLYFVSDRDGGRGGLDIWMIAVKDLK